jgi:hypothetical protein
MRFTLEMYNAAVGWMHGASAPPRYKDALPPKLL